MTGELVTLQCDEIAVRRNVAIVVASFGSWDQFMADFKGVATMRGIGWLRPSPWHQSALR